VADNAINHYESLKPMIDMALSDDRVDALVVRLEKANWCAEKGSIEAELYELFDLQRNNGRYELFAGKGSDRERAACLISGCGY
jgi:hypothetical protein